MASTGRSWSSRKQLCRFWLGSWSRRRGSTVFTAVSPFAEGRKRSAHMRTARNPKDPRRHFGEALAVLVLQPRLPPTVRVMVGILDSLFASLGDQQSSLHRSVDRSADWRHRPEHLPPRFKEQQTGRVLTERFAPFYPSRPGPAPRSTKELNLFERRFIPPLHAAPSGQRTLLPDLTSPLPDRECTSWLRWSPESSGRGMKPSGIPPTAGRRPSEAWCRPWSGSSGSIGAMGQQHLHHFDIARERRLPGTEFAPASLRPRAARWPLRISVFASFSRRFALTFTLWSSRTCLIKPIAWSWHWEPGSSRFQIFCG